MLKFKNLETFKHTWRPNTQVGLRTAGTWLYYTLLQATAGIQIIDRVGSTNRCRLTAPDENRTPPTKFLNLIRVYYLQSCVYDTNMNEDEGGIKFVSCIGSDIDIWKKLPNDENYECETCLLYDEPEYHLDDPECVNTTWKFFDHITKRYLLGNGKDIFHYQKYECPPLVVKISTPLYTLQELCKYTISTRLFANKISNTAIDEMELPEQFKTDIKSCVQTLGDQYDADGDGDDCNQDCIVCHEEEHHY